GCRVSPAGVSQSRWLHTYGSALRLCRSSLGYTPSVWATDLHTTTLHTESCLPSAAGGAGLLHSEVSRGSEAAISLRARLLGTVTARRFPPPPGPSPSTPFRYSSPISSVMLIRAKPTSSAKRAL